MQQSETEDVDPSLDFLSPEFDPLSALQASPSDIQLPCPDAPPCDNLHRYLSVVRGSRRTGGHKTTQHRKMKDPQRASGGADDAALRQERRKEKTVLWFMENTTSGPMSLLQRCHGTHKRVRVWMRHCAGVRGVCEGVILAFDRHFNLVLGNVSEEYNPFRTVANGGTDGRKKRRKGRKEGGHLLPPADTDKPEKLTRHVNQLFVRGDNVISIAVSREDTD